MSDVTTAAGPPSRLGRDLRAAILVGVGLGVVILASLFFIRELFIAVVAVSVAVATSELAGALRRGGGIQVALVPALVGGQAMLWLALPFGTTGVLAAAAVTVLVCLLWRMPGGPDGYLRDISASLFTVVYVPFFAAFAGMLVIPQDGTGRVLSWMLCVVASDVGGYTAGVLAGRHPMAPTISPKKSWEGFGGSLLGGMIAGGLCVAQLLHGHWWLGALFGALVVVVATSGDLIESLVKRDLGIKDMGTLLPGHGGLMDRMDSLLPTAMVSWLLLSVFVPVGQWRGWR
ncbi:phosphatidate cytidylyltransferase [Pseudonocardia sp.]|uniref:phosphatidate cytidylyltransferase n=1 Tax=Pseudonocardia sp. TaxID=60912 RepID=UPI0039C95086